MQPRPLNTDMNTYDYAWFLEGVPEPIIDQRILSHLHNYQRECADTNETYVIHYTGMEQSALRVCMQGRCKVGAGDPVGDPRVRPWCVRGPKVA